MTFERACRHIENFTAGHESARDGLGAVVPPDLADYPDNHIESDNRLSWFLGRLDETYGDDAVYVRLVRAKTKVAASYNKKWEYETAIMKAYGEGILMHGAHIPDSFATCEDYWETVNSNIRLFLKDKTRKLCLDVDNPKAAFTEFWEKIGAEGDLHAALAEWDVHHNATRKNWQPASLSKRIERHLRRTPGLEALKRRLLFWRKKYRH
jgi:hypothetical protein